MSIQDVAIVLNNSQAQGRAKLVLLGIANHADDNRVSWPSIATLARYANASERSINRDLVALVELGELEIVKNGAPVAGQYRPNLYRLLVVSDTENRGDNLTPLEGSGVTELSSGVTAQVIRGDNCGVQNHQLTINKNHQLSKAQPIAEDWELDDDLIRWTADIAPSLNWRLEVEQFRNYWLEQSGKNALKKNWGRAWRNWVINAVKWNPTLANKPVVQKEKHRFTGYVD